MARQDSNTTDPNSTIPKSDYGFYELIISLFLRHSDELVLELEKTHERWGRHGYPARDQLCVFLLQCLLSERYNNHLLNELSASPKFLQMCKISEVPTEYAYCRFKKNLVPHLAQMAEIYDLTLRDFAREIRRMKKTGDIPKEAPQLGQYLAIDATDIPAWARYRSPHCNAPDNENCTQKHKRHCNNPDRTKCTTHSNKPIADPSAMLGYRTPKLGFAQFKRRTRGNPPFGGRGWQGVPVRLGGQPTVKNPQMPATGGGAPGRWHPRRSATVCRTRPQYAG